MTDCQLCAGKKVEGKAKAAVAGEKQERTKGDPEAVMYAMLNNTGVPQGFKLGDTVYFTNSVDHAEDLEEGRITLRAVNMPGRPLHRTLDRVASWYGSDVNPSRAETLKKYRMY